MPSILSDEILVSGVINNHKFTLNIFKTIILQGSYNFEFQHTLFLQHFFSVKSYFIAHTFVFLVTKMWRLPVRLLWIFVIVSTFCEFHRCDDFEEAVKKAATASDEEEEFVATNEWQEIKPGQAIPPGLHVRLNLESGQREAKLLDTENDESNEKSEVSIVSDPTVEGEQKMEEISEDRRMLRMKKAMEDALKDLHKEDRGVEEPVYWKDGEKEGMMNMFKDHFTQEELKEALKKYKSEKDDVQDEALRMEEIKNKFRPIEELRKEMEDLNLNVKTDMEILTELSEEYSQEELSLEDRLRILTDLEYYVHQIDNAVHVLETGAMALVIKDLNHTDPEVKEAAAFVMGSAAQSNPTVQISLMESGALTHLLRLLAVEKRVSLQSRLVYAVSSLLRHFPYAQMSFLQQGGLQAFRDIMVLRADHKVKVKIVTLVGDLIREQNSMVKLPHLVAEDKALREKVKQYKKVQLYDALLDQGWCDLIPSMLYLRDHDQREKVLDTMQELLQMQICHRELATYHSALTDLYKEYEKLVTEELSQDIDPVEDSYFTKFIEVILNIKSKIKPYVESDTFRDEL